MSLFPIIILAGIGWLLYTLYFKKLLAQGKVGKLKIAVIALGVVFLVMAATGKAHALFAIIGAAMTQIMRFAPLFMRFGPSIKQHLGGRGNKASNAPPGVSTVATATLVMTLDQSNGKVDGDVVSGEFQGKKLSELDLPALKTLYAYCSLQDSDALRLLQTYISRERAADWQFEEHDQNENNNQRSRSMGQGEMPLAEAQQVLGLTDEFTRKQVTAAHRSLMGRFHPDKGGNDYLATKLNTARDVLLNHLKTQA